MNNNIRVVTQNDVEKLKIIIDSCELFSSEYLEEMMFDYLNNVNTQDIWFAYFDENVPIAIGYCIPEKLTNGTYNLLAIGVLPDYQRKGIATEMIKYIEQLIKLQNGRILIIETSSDPAQIGARKFYKKIGYMQMAVIKDFWNDGEDKIVFVKKLL